MSNFNKKNIRFFNKFENIDNKFIIKSFIGDNLQYKNKFINEILWLKEAQKIIPEHVPQIIDYSIDEKKPWVKYKFINLETVHDIFLKTNNSFDEAYWDKLITTIKKLFSKFRAIRPETLKYDEWRNNLFEFSLKRLYTTIEKLMLDQNFNLFSKNDTIIINDIKYPSLKLIKNYLKKVIEQVMNNSLEKKSIFNALLNPNENRICFTHLDMVFGNIFFDKENGNIIIIDPRGKSYSNNNWFGDIYYDYAKFYQSIYGLYELVCEDLFEIQITNNEISYKIHELKNLKKIQEKFDQLFKEIDINLIKLIESFQFFTMIPAHIDNHERQILELCIAIKHFSEVVGNEIWK